MSQEAAALQAAYYVDTVADYDDAHVVEGDEHYRALEFMSLFLEPLDVRRVLDVGSGTGRGVAYFAGKGVHAVGIEPVEALIDRAVRVGRADGATLVRGGGDRLPFPDQSFDIVCETGVLHHVSDPSTIVAEMCRVARRGVFLSDDNRFANGRLPAKMAKLALWKLGLWDLAYGIRTGGRRYRVCEDDGVWMSYSVYDSLEQLGEWADRVVLVPTDADVPATASHPLLTSGHILACAIRGPLGPRP